MVAVIGTCDNGGMLQFAIQIYIALRKNGEDAKLVIPASAQYDSKMLADYSDGVVSFNLKNNTPAFPSLRETLLLMGSRCLLFVDSTMTAKMEIIRLFRSSTNISLFIHDAAPHPTNRKQLIVTIRNAWHEILNYMAYRHVNCFVFMSENTRESFRRIYPHLRKPMIKFPIGSLVQCSESLCPPELAENVRDYFLLMGRIAAYKNIELALRCFLQTDVKEKLIIAGKGDFSQTEQELITALGDRVILIHRYILDAEMTYLAKHAKCILLSYKEASQSGLIPIAYSFGVPIISTNQDGLAEFIENEKTGYICDTEQNFCEAMRKMSNRHDKTILSDNAYAYYYKNLDWEQNAKKLIANIQKGQNLELGSKI